MSRHQLGDPQFEYGDITAQRSPSGPSRRAYSWPPLPLPRRPWSPCGLVDALDAFLDPLLGAAVVRVEELAQGAAMGVLQEKYGGAG